jgi:hypothetical protein
MESLKNLINKIVKNAPGYQQKKADGSYTSYLLANFSNMLYNRDRMSFTRLFGVGFHIEGEKTLFDKRLKTGINRHNRYFGPRGEILFYIGLVWIMTKFLRNNLTREQTVETIMNDRNIYLRVNLPYSDRLIQ